MMNNHHDETKKVLVGLLIGVIGAGALYCVYAAQHRKTPVLKKIGRTIADVGEMIENCNLSCLTDVAENIEDKLPKGADLLNNLGEWVSTGMKFWKKISK